MLRHVMPAIDRRGFAAGVRRLGRVGAGACALALAAPAARADLPATIALVKPSIVLVGRYRETDNPRFTLGGTGFVVGDGNLAVTNAHVVERPPGAPEADAGELTVQVRSGTEWRARRARLLELDPAHDLALLRFEGAAVPALGVRDSDGVREGQAVATMGFPLGGALGFTPVTHRGTISAITPIALPSPSARQLTPQAIRRLREGPFDIFQLDATTYPGNSGGPLFDPDSGDVLGVVNMGVVKRTKEAAIGQPSGISFAVPSKFVLRLLNRPRPQ